MTGRPDGVPYGVGHIQVLEGLEAVRKRPGMYVGSDGAGGLLRLVAEVVGHAVAEVVAGHATAVDVTLTADGGVRVADDGRGLPVGVAGPTSGEPALESVLTELRGGYPDSRGSCGTGLAVVNGLSRRLTAEVRRDGFRWTQEYARGVPLAPPARREATDAHGTTLTLWADDELFTTTTHSFTALARHVRELAYLCGELTVSLTDERPEADRNTVRYRRDGGLRGFLTHLDAREGEPAAPVHPTVIGFEAGSCEVALRWDWLGHHPEEAASIVRHATAQAIG
ncbi:ATP-binding protein [Streptomyces sp. NBC_00249]|uniref:ATP-binding protein n=1 Tax=Streptomyces sp. NBC_00249 TaxID=2975690 RepID=UPI0022575DE9|nr:ATP-binding protein [Streptomyces sp. NBC_00249]MCX5192497.1 ATP-binding protein [Streptomyces sp. NBC_00249]